MTTLFAGLKKQVFLSSGTFEVPERVSNVFVFGCGGGGGGAASSNYSGGGGGAGAVPTWFPCEVQPGEKIAVTVGAGGAGGTWYTGNGSAGGTSSFKNISFFGANGGRGPASASAAGLGGSSGSGLGLFTSGGNGAMSFVTFFNEAFSPATPGQSSPFASGGSRGGYDSNGVSYESFNPIVYDLPYKFGGGGGGGGGFGQGESGGTLLSLPAFDSSVWAWRFLALPGDNTGRGGGGGGGFPGDGRYSSTVFNPGGKGGDGLVTVFWSAP